MSVARALIILLFTFTILVLLTINLFKIQVSRHDEYKYLAERQQNQTRILKSERGLIFDRNGEALAFNKTAVSFYADKRMLTEENKAKIINKFSKIFNRPAKYYEDILNQNSKIAALEKKVSKETAIELKDFIVDGLFFEEDPERVYPYDNLASHIIGYVNEKIAGVSGIEKYYNDRLKGADGKLFYFRDVKGRQITVSEDRSSTPENGSSVYLTINKNYQIILENELKNAVKDYRSVSAVGIIMDPNNGEILAMAVSPDYDPNKFWEYGDSERRNKILTDTYEPGSTFKSIVLSILLDKGLISEGEKIYGEQGYYKLKNATVRDDYKYEYLTVREVLEKSSNVGMAKLSQKLSDEDFYKYLRDFGFGNYTFVDLPGEAPGMLKKPNRFASTTKPFMSFGYEISATPIQMIAAYSALVNGGNLYKPHLLKKIEKNGETFESDKSYLIRRIISENASRKIISLMAGVVANGTGKNAALEIVNVGGKTGTSQLWMGERYSKANYNSSFIGFFPVENPKVVCLVLLNSPQIEKYGGKAAAPVFKKIAQKLIDSDPSLAKNEYMKKSSTEAFNLIFTSKDKNEKKINAATNINKSAESLNSGGMPDLRNFHLREAIKTLVELGIKYKVEGSGRVVYQSIAPGNKIQKGAVCVIKCEPNA